MGVPNELSETVLLQYLSEQGHLWYPLSNP